MNCAQCRENEKIDGLEPECETCWQLDLSPDNQEIIELYEIIRSDFVRDFGALELVFKTWGIDCECDDRETIMRLIMIHNYLRSNPHPIPVYLVKVYER